MIVASTHMGPPAGGFVNGDRVIACLGRRVVVHQQRADGCELGGRVDCEAAHSGGGCVIACLARRVVAR